MKRIAEIKRRLRRLPELHAIGENGRERYFWADRGSHTWTISPVPGVDGWRTDGGCEGYGLPQQVAEDVAALRADVEWLLSELESLELQQLADGERT